VSKIMCEQQPAATQYHKGLIYLCVTHYEDATTDTHCLPTSTKY